MNSIFYLTPIFRQIGKGSLLKSERLPIYDFLKVLHHDGEGFRMRYYKINESYSQDKREIIYF
jgi:hypothetical protein